MIPIRVLRRRIRSIRSTAKITKAMEMIAASKMRRAQERALGGRPYAEKMNEVLADLAAQPQEGGVLHPLMESRPVNHIAIVHIAADRGLCGGSRPDYCRHFRQQSRVAGSSGAGSRGGRREMLQPAA